MIHSLTGPLPHHQYVWIDTRYTHHQPQTPRWQPAIWFGLTSNPGRMWGCTCLLESGAVYRALPPMAIAFKNDPVILKPHQAQAWDCYGTDFSVCIYPYLVGVWGNVKIGKSLKPGRYLFSASPIGDGFSLAPDQAKEFHFLALDAGGLSIQPTNRVVYTEKSFTVPGKLPEGLKTQTDTYYCE